MNDIQKDNSIRKESNAWKYSSPVKDLSEVICSPFMNDSQEEKNDFCKVLKHYEDQL